MEVLREVNCRVMKGLGPEWKDKTITVFLDDVEDGLHEDYIVDMVRNDAKSQLRRAGYHHYRIGDIYSA